MLVLSRQRDESIVFTVPPSDKPTEITVTVVDLRGDKVRLGSTAPNEVTVDREEVHRGKVREAKAAAEKAPEAEKVQATP